MKKMLLLTLGLLALGVTVASAQGTISLAYGVCRLSSTVGANDFVWPNSTPDPCSDPANSGLSAVLIPAFKNSAAVANFSLATTKLDILVGNGTTLSNFWDIDGACHTAGISAAGGIGAPDNAPALPVNCGNPFGSDQTQTNAFGDVENSASGRIHWEGDHGRQIALATLTVPAAAGGYISNYIRISWDDAAFDGASCAGCTDPACIVLNTVDLFNSSGAIAAHMEAPAAGVQNFITYYGGTANCPGAVPTKNATWGAVKALYR